MNKTERQNFYSLGVFLLCAVVYLLTTSCSTVNLDCTYVHQDNGKLIPYCKVPKDDKPIGRGN
jgi:hypothetical protein